jgi:hypothetical protein
LIERVTGQLHCLNLGMNPCLKTLPFLQLAEVRGQTA